MLGDEYNTLFIIEDKWKTNNFSTYIIFWQETVFYAPYKIVGGH